MHQRPSEQCAAHHRDAPFWRDRVKMPIRLTLGLLLVIFFVPSTAWANFSDVPENHEHYKAIQWMESRKVVEGYDDGTFRPDQKVARAEALKIILLGSGAVVSSDVAADAPSLFPDVTAQDWFYPYIQKSLELKLIQGYTDGTFQPHKTINLAESLKLISLAEGISTSVPPSSPYPDVSSTLWFAPYVSYSKQRNFIQAHRDGLLHPDYDMTRGDLVELMYRFSYTEEFGLPSFDLATTWLEFQNDRFSYAFKVPFDWQMISASNGEVILWHRDTPNGQVTWDRIYPNASTVSMFVDDNVNGLTPSQYFSAVQKQWEGAASSLVSSDLVASGYLSLLVARDNGVESFLDLYVSLPNGQFLVLNGTYGHGSLKDQLAAHVEAIEKNVRYSEGAPAGNPDEAIEQARALIRVDAKGKTALALFPDLKLIETDTIGIGTGPVDYYYSGWANVTLKYERSYDVLLDVVEGETSAF